ncbi:hypothetical protein [Actinomadura sp. HBU206391]|uniref:hypothetical protein n=1 Tax=Actinomadura sp. HBU206391 TaxID=2731692 RepID=UPI00164F7C05|nr:hypothetical protein [Actinomadura sp. HBU206391]MBC6458820.1 hypothetical protein [Actinomadura sp. HBU206391]
MQKILIVAVPLVLALSACSGFSNERGWGDAPVSKRDDSAAEVINYPNQFGNVAHKCDGHGHRVYVVTHAKSDVAPVVVTDPSCPGGAETTPSAVPTASPSPG